MTRLTEVVELDPLAPDPGAMERAAKILRAGGLVAFPTETVYGLGANALDAAAVARIFEAKGRPATNPVIVHVASVSQARELVVDWPDAADQLIKAFWPGPLTLVLKRAANVPEIVAAGGRTVGIRMPANAIAQALIRAAGVPLAAPSANLSTELSATTAAHVFRALEGRIDLLLDGGPCAKGIESTVLDLTCSPARLLRPGSISVRQLEEILGDVDTSALVPNDEVARAPGQMDRHYAPRTPLLAFEGGAAAQVEKLIADGKAVGWLAFPEENILNSARLVRREMPRDPEAYASLLYAELHRFDMLDLEIVVVSNPPDTDEWRAIRDRLRRASHAER